MCENGPPIPENTYCKRHALEEFKNKIIVLLEKWGNFSEYFSM